MTEPFSSRNRTICNYLGIERTVQSKERMMKMTSIALLVGRCCAGITCDGGGKRAGS
jgi:hypothetical protein